MVYSPGWDFLWPHRPRGCNELKKEWLAQGIPGSAIYSRINSLSEYFKVEFLPGKKIFGMFAVQHGHGGQHAGR